MKIEKEILPGDTLTIRIPKNVEPKVLIWINNQGSINGSIIQVIEREIDMNGVINLSPVTVDQLASADEMGPYVFEGIQNNKSEEGIGLQELYDHVALKLNITDAERSISSQGNASLYENRIRWIIKRMKSQGLIKVMMRGHYKLTEDGEALDNGKAANTFEDLFKAFDLNKRIKQEAEFQELMAKLGVSPNDVNTVIEANYIQRKINNNSNDTQ
ncbi:winged helix-turn-helix domain-containing protein [Clostridium sp.]